MGKIKKFIANTDYDPGMAEKKKHRIDGDLAEFILMCLFTKRVLKMSCAINKQNSKPKNNIK